MIHEGVQNILCFHFCVNDGDRGSDTSVSILILALKYENCKIIILAVVSIPLINLVASLESPSIRFCPRGNLEIRIGFEWIYRASICRLLK